MATDKKGFMLYADQQELFNQLSNEQAGELIKHVFSYVNDENPKTDSLIINLAFTPIKQQLKRDLKKWEQRADRSRENGLKGGRPPKPKEPSGLIDNPDEPKEPDRVKVSDIVIDKVKVIDKDIITKPTVKTRYAQDVIDCVKNCLVHFDGHLHPKTPKQKLQWCEVVEKLNRIDGIPYEQIEAITEWARNDEFWASNFLALPKLRKKNKDGLLWILVFSEKLKRNDNNKPLTEQQQQIANSRSVQNIIDRRKEDRRRAELSNDSPTD